MMPVYKACATQGGFHSFQVTGPENMWLSAVNGFLYHLSFRDRSPYTLRAYAIGMAHFLNYLHEHDIPLAATSRTTIANYIQAFGQGSKEGAVQVDTARAGQLNPLTRKRYPTKLRQARTINHRLSVLSSFFNYLIQHDSAQLEGEWSLRDNPVPEARFPRQSQADAFELEAPRPRRGEFRRRVPRQVPKCIDAELFQKLVDTATSWRDKTLLTLLLRTGQRIGEWSDKMGCHGVLGMSLADLDEARGTITIRLKGDRSEHRVPVTDDVWPLFHHYLEFERGGATTEALWVGLRRGKGKPLSYRTFEASLRYLNAKLGTNVHAHMLRHSLAQGVVDATGNLKAAQTILGHKNLSTTADLYVHADEQMIVKALGAARALHSQDLNIDGTSQSDGYAFAYDEVTLTELEAASHLLGRSEEEGN